MESLVIDASVVLKWFFDFPEEEDREKAIEIKNLHAQGYLRLVLPQYSVYEIANALTFSRYKLSEEIVFESLEALESLAITKVHDRKLLKQAVHIAKTYGVSVYDALYLAVAQRSKCKLVTADDKFVRRVKKDEKLVCLLSNYEPPTS